MFPTMFANACERLRSLVFGRGSLVPADCSATDGLASVPRSRPEAVVVAGSRSKWHQTGSTRMVSYSAASLTCWTATEPSGGSCELPSEIRVTIASPGLVARASSSTGLVSSPDPIPSVVAHQKPPFVVRLLRARIGVGPDPTSDATSAVS